MISILDPDYTVNQFGKETFSSNGGKKFNNPEYGSLVLKGTVQHYFDPCDLYYQLPELSFPNFETIRIFGNYNDLNKLYNSNFLTEGFIDCIITNEEKLPYSHSVYLHKGENDCRYKPKKDALCIKSFDLKNHKSIKLLSAIFPSEYVKLKVNNKSSNPIKHFNDKLGMITLEQEVYEIYDRHLIKIIRECNVEGEVLHLQKFIDSFSKNGLIKGKIVTKEYCIDRIPKDRLSYFRYDINNGSFATSISKFVKKTKFGDPILGLDGKEIVQINEFVFNSHNQTKDSNDSLIQMKIDDNLSVCYFQQYSMESYDWYGDYLDNIDDYFSFKSYRAELDEMYRDAFENDPFNEWNFD